MVQVAVVRVMVTKLPRMVVRELVVVMVIKV
jgi:hypothetical protein